MQDIIDEVKEVVLRAGEEVMKIYRTDFKVEEKDDNSPVTEADLVADKMILDGLKKYGWPILSEESKDDLSRMDSDRVWIVDSLDGTSDFVQKTDEFSIMVALAGKGRPILGFVYVPPLKKMYYASQGQGSFLQMGDKASRQIKVTDQAHITKATLVVSRNHLKDEDKALAGKMGITNLKRSGSNGVKMGLIAEGQADIFFNSTGYMSQWDLCAPEIILIEAGGETSDTRGETIIYNKEELKIKYGMLASNGKLHSAALPFMEQPIL